MDLRGGLTCVRFEARRERRGARVWTRALRFLFVERVCPRPPAHSSLHNLPLPPPSLATSLSSQLLVHHGPLPARRRPPHHRRPLDPPGRPGRGRRPGTTAQLGDARARREQRERESWLGSERKMPPARGGERQPAARPCRRPSRARTHARSGPHSSHLMACERGVFDQSGPAARRGRKGSVALERIFRSLSPGPARSPASPSPPPRARPPPHPYIPGLPPEAGCRRRDRRRHPGGRPPCVRPGELWCETGERDRGAAAAAVPGRDPLVSFAR